LKQPDKFREDARILRGTFGSVGGQKVLFILLEAGGYFEQSKSHEEMIIRNFCVALLEKMGIWITAESRQASIQQALHAAFEKDIIEKNERHE